MHGMSSTSIFGYPLTRRYPSHFTWIICAGGVILVTLFTFIAFAGNAFEAEQIYTADINGTLDSKQWFQKRPFTWASEIDTSCQPAFLTIGSDYTTTNQGFIYTIDSFRAGNTSEVPYTVRYWNSTLSDCEVQQIEINLLKQVEAGDATNFWTWDDTYARSTTECFVYTESGPLRVNFTHQLPTVKQRKQITNSFITVNSTAHPGKWLGAQIAEKWYGVLGSAMGNSLPVNQDGIKTGSSWGSGSIVLRKSTVADYESHRFFTCASSVTMQDGGLAWIPSDLTLEDWMNQWDPSAMAAIDRKGPFGLPNISTVVDVFGKTYYSLLLSDFNSTEDVRSTNVISTAKGLEYLQSVFSNETAEEKFRIDKEKDRNAKFDENAGRIHQVFDPNTANLTQPLATAAYTTLVLQYLCSQPIRKSTFKLILAVLVADIVFLSACWTVFGWIATWWLGRRDSTVEHCAGCLAANQDLPLTPLPGPSKGGSYSRVSDMTGEEVGGSDGERPSVARGHSGV